MVFQENKKIVILGGGFGGVRAALDLARLARKTRIVLIDRNPYHIFTSDLYELAGAFLPGRKLSSRDDFLKLRSAAAIPFGDIFGKYRNVELKIGEIRGIDFAKKEVQTDAEKINYDFLILALGSQTNFFGIRNLSEKALGLKSIDDVLNIRAALEEKFASSGKHETISIVIGGGGFTGCELAGELALSCRLLAKSYGHPVENLSIVILEGSDRLLPSAHPWISKKAKIRLESIGVRVLLGSLIVDVTEREAILKGKPSQPYHLLIWTAGVGANSLAESASGLELGKNKCVAVDRNLRALSYPDVFVIGDLAYCVIPGAKVPLPMTAQVAIDQGHYAANYLASKLGGRALTDFHPKIWRFLVPLGGKYALADLGKIRFAGFIPWALKRFAALKYFLSILPFGKALGLWWRGLRIFTQND
ncbi:MAG: NAD(P)/FAD-dependent oxidoreductase [bacterium]|nr:NAD(P)/FAD-dependent oxidoreductase [bacterium]